VSFILSRRGPWRLPRHAVRVREMKACKAQSMSDAPNPPKEVGDVEKTASGQMSFWPDTPEESSDNPEKTTSSNSSIDAIEDASCMLPFGETLLALASIKGLGFRTLISFFKAFGGRIEDVWEVPPVELQLRLESFKIPSLSDASTKSMPVLRQNLIRL
jgi:hypothetical protein